MTKFWNWIRDDEGERILRLEGPIDEQNTWGDGITPSAFRDELEATGWLRLLRRRDLQHAVRLQGQGDGED